MSWFRIDIFSTPELTWIEKLPGSVAPFYQQGTDDDTHYHSDLSMSVADPKIRLVPDDPATGWWLHPSYGAVVACPTLDIFYVPEEP